jgi:hypothetical protein
MNYEIVEKCKKVVNISVLDNGSSVRFPAGQ